MKESPQHCTFCKILRGELPGSVIYEDDKIMAIVDLYPVNEGHLLIIPKVHAPYMKDVAPETLQHMMLVAQQINAALRSSGLPCEGVNLLLADGEVAGQEIFHCHLHLIPRFATDGFGFRYDRSRSFRQASRGRMDEIAARVKARLEKA